MDILFDKNSTKSVVELNLETVKDLALDEIVECIARGNSEKKIIRGIFTKIPTDLEDIRYRQAILKDFMENEVLVDELAEVFICSFGKAKRAFRVCECGGKYGELSEEA